MVLRPPAPVTAAVHGVSAEPVYVAEVGHVITVDEAALATTRDPSTRSRTPVEIEPPEQWVTYVPAAAVPVTAVV